MKKIIVVGGGPAGIMAAISAKTYHPSAHVTLIERNPSLGVKLRITGGGRCNVTADVSSEQIVKNTPKNGRFLYSALHQFSTKDIQKFFNSRGCALKIEERQRVFPQSDQSLDIVNTLLNELQQCQVKVVLNTLVTQIDMRKKVIVSDQDKAMSFDYCILATGGVSYPKTGSDIIGFELIKQCNHQVTPLKPAEVPLVSNDEVIQSKKLMGLSFNDVLITAYVNHKKKISITHDMIFTHFGVSGPGILQVSSYLVNEFENETMLELSFDFLRNDALETLLKHVDIEKYCQSQHIPKRFIAYLKETYSSDWIRHLKDFRLSIYSSRGFNHAFVTSGGVSIKEIDPKTMKSKHHQSLSICGEALDVNSLTGGYNMSVAFSTGHCAGKHII